MKFLSAEVYNFASYKELRFDFTEQGLTLISGPTGAGKSTLCDVIPWVLWGKTAKNGAADEVRAWGEADSTDGTVKFLVNGHMYYVRRIRGKSNDLYYGPVTDYMAEGKRGKDLNDTQKLINQLLNMDAETYLAGSYLHEFSQTSQFFTATAKIRRTITEQLADLFLAKTLQEKVSSYNKDVRKDLEGLKQQALLQLNTLEQLHKQVKTETIKIADWEKTHKIAIDKIIAKSTDFDSDKIFNIKELEVSRMEYEQENHNKIADVMLQIKELEHVSTTISSSRAEYLESRKLELAGNKCKECGADKHSSEILIIDKELYKYEQEIKQREKNQIALIGLNTRLSLIKKQVNPYLKLIEQEKDRKNTYLEQLEAVKQEENPYIKSKESITVVISTAQLELNSINALVEELSIEQSDIELLVSIINDFRGAIITRTVSYLQDNTNKLLNDHFDAEIRVHFSVQDSDKLDVEITKDGNTCSYTQLSKGQRQLLKLCFGVSVMKACSNYNGVNFNCLWFDESLDGMDESMKAKSYTLLEALSTDYDSIFVVEHSESFKSLFINCYEVSLTSNGSQIEKA